MEKKEILEASEIGNEKETVIRVLLLKSSLKFSVIIDDGSAYEHFFTEKEFDTINTAKLYYKYAINQISYHME